MVCDGGGGDDAVAHGHVLVLTLDEACLSGDRWGQVLDLQAADEHCLVADFGFFFSYFAADSLDGLAYDNSRQYAFLSLNEFTYSARRFLPSFGAG